MTTNYALAHPKHKFVATSFHFTLRRLFTLVMLICFCFMGFSQKGKKGKGDDDSAQVVLLTCIEDLGNGMYKAYFGYTNPTDQPIIVDQKDSFLYLNDHIDDDESDDDDVENHRNGVEKLPGITTFLPGTHDKAFFAVFNASGHAKWTVVFRVGNKKNKVKIRANSESSICPDDSVIRPVFGGAGKSMTPVGAELTALATGQATGSNGEAPSNIIFQLNDQDEVLIEIIPKPCPTCLNDVKLLLQGTFNRSLSDFIVDPDVVIAKGYAAYDVYFPISRLLELNDYPDLLNFSRTLYPPALEVGVVTSQGDAAMLTNNVRESFVTRADEFSPGMPVDGSGIKIAAISDSFNKANPPGQAETDVGNGDLPGAANPNYTTEVVVLKDFPIVASDEGRAMLQIIHDVAPGAELGFSTGVLSPRDMALAIDNFAAAGYDVITDDVTYPMAPFFQDGEIAEAVRRFTDPDGHGGTYITSAGNFADVAEQGLFLNSSDSPIPITLPSFLPAGTIAHRFNGAQQITRDITVDAGTYFLVLQWEEPLASQGDNIGATKDLDIYILAEDGEQVLVNTNRINLDGDAAEAVVFQSIQDGATAKIMITSANGPAPSNLGFRYIVFRATGLTLVGSPGASTISGHAMTPEAITVGAVNHTELQNLPLDPETFSSYAGTLPNGTETEVDIAAPDGVEVSVPGFANFKGTSAAAPHIAGAFGLLLSAQDSWYPSGLPKEPLQLFQDNALPIVEGGGLLQAGVGLIEAEAAFKEIAAQTAVLISVSVNPDQAEEEAPEPVLGIDPTEITITGNYIPDDPIVYLGDGEERIPLDPISSSETEIVVTVPSLVNLETPIFGNPNLVVYTPPITDGRTDGGESAPISLFEVPVLYLIADDLPHEEGEPITYGDAFTYTYRVEGLPEGLVIGEDLPNVILSSPADPLAPFPNVDIYVIFPSFDEENATPEQLAELESYRVNEITGRLNITQKDLTITPEPLDGLTYGEAIVLTLNYDYDNSNIPDENKEAFDMLIKNEHSEDFFPVNTLSVINRFNAVVNSEVFNELNGGSWMASENSLTNRFNAVVNDLGEELMGLVNLDIEALEFYIEIINNRFNAVVNTNRFNAVVNGQGLVNGLTTLNNRFVAVVNSDISADDNTFNKVFAVLNVDDEAEDLDGDVDLVEFYALNLITGLDVTGSGEGQVPEHNSYAGAFIAPTAANFNITYNLSTLMIPNKAQLVALTFPMGEISYGTILTQEDIELELGGYVYGETAESVFADPDCVPEDLPEGEICPFLIPYYFVDEAGTEFEFGTVLDAGNYQIKIREPKNYEIEYEEVGNVEVLKRELTVNADQISIVFGQTLSVEDIRNTEEECPEEVCEFSVIQGFANEEDENMYFEENDDNPYYLIPIIDGQADELNEISLGTLLDAGSYAIRARQPSNPNYSIEYAAHPRGVVTVTPASLTVEADPISIEYGLTLEVENIINTGEECPEVGCSVIQGFADEEAEAMFFAEFEGNPYYLVPIIDGEANEEVIISLSAPLEVGSYGIRVWASENDNYFISPSSSYGVVTVTPATLTACIADIEIREGNRLFPQDIQSQITGYKFDELDYFDTQETVFPNGIIYLAGVYNPVTEKVEDLVEIPPNGILLDEGIYTILIKEDDIKNYTITYGTTCNGTGKVLVSACGDVPFLDFSTFIQITDSHPLSEGTIYRFKDVWPGGDGIPVLDALVSIREIESAEIEILDRNRGTDNAFFQPEIRFWKDEEGPVPYVEFEIRFVEKGSYTTYSLDALIASFVDVDGLGDFQEYNQVSLPESYTVDNHRDIDPEVIGDMLKINGASSNTGGVGNSNPRINVEASYKDISTLIFIFGADGDGAFDTNNPRQAGIQFTCLNNFVDPQTFYPDAEYTTTSAPDNNGVVYPNPVDDYLYIERDNNGSGTVEIIDYWMPGTTRITVVLDENTGVQNQPLEIDVSSLIGHTYYKVLITVNGVVEDYLIYKN